MNTFERDHFQDDIVYSPRNIADDKRGVDYTDSRMRDLIELSKNLGYTAQLVSYLKISCTVTAKIDYAITEVMDKCAMYSNRLSGWRNDSAFDSLKQHFMDYLMDYINL